MLAPRSFKEPTEFDPLSAATKLVTWSKKVVFSVTRVHRDVKIRELTFIAVNLLVGRWYWFCHY